MDPVVVLSERDARPAPPPIRLPAFEEALALAGDDAARLGQRDIQPENLLIGLLRAGHPELELLAHAGQMDIARFRGELADRLGPSADRVEPHDLPMNADAQGAVKAAVALAAERRGDVVHGVHLLLALTRAAHGPATALLARYGANVATLNVELEKWL
jgi:ATP-dependent Clp protease ATP-binding subunit ClpA